MVVLGLAKETVKHLRAWRLNQLSNSCHQYFRYGFLKPGTKNLDTSKAHGVRCGSTHGAGIYSSPSADFSLSYTHPDLPCHQAKPSEFFGQKLIVCATLMGHSAPMDREHHCARRRSLTRAPTHVDNRELEYAASNPARIIPVFVADIDRPEENAEHFESLSAGPCAVRPYGEETAPQPAPGHALGRAQAAPESRRFVVEEVAEDDEDEEGYGEYQPYRGEEVKDKSNLDFWSWVKAGEEENAARDAKGSADTAGELAHGRKAWGPIFSIDGCFEMIQRQSSGGQAKGRNCAELEVLFEKETNARKYETTVVDISPVEEKILKDD
ncbi:hypothetical protein DL764_000508 [Monosporascus ibericus]|uniref:PARP catalytic domain-containing protein n=1 Tax=Monosporascus ibericus TaxID=155417 RepID=A0A4Q4TV56_9PEZI|nr:hypothetical protein DL764_000508 [Monosporascus ibericus]